MHSAVRTALLNHLVAARNLELLRSEVKIRDDQINILDQIFSAGETPRQSVDAARIELSKIRMAIDLAEGQAGETRAVLAAAVGLPVAALQRADFSWLDLDTPPGAESLLPAEIQRQAVLNRLDLRRSLAQYAAAEAALQLEIARQYPEITIGPGYTYEEKHSFFTLGLSTVVPLFNRNQGPIAEAEAHRKEVAALFLERQAQVIARSERALAAYTAALKELAEADSLVRLQATQRQILQQGIHAGTDTRLNLDNVEIQAMISARARLDALARAQRALGELADAVQRPLDPGDVFTIAPESSSPESPGLLGPSKDLKR
jgi:outer membrane protein TolC